MVLRETKKRGAENISLAEPISKPISRKSSSRAETWAFNMQEDNTIKWFMDTFFIRPYASNIGHDK